MVSNIGDEFSVQEISTRYGKDQLLSWSKWSSAVILTRCCYMKAHTCRVQLSNPDQYIEIIINRNQNICGSINNIDKNSRIKEEMDDNENIEENENSLSDNEICKYVLQE